MIDLKVVECLGGSGKVRNVTERCMGRLSAGCFFSWVNLKGWLYKKNGGVQQVISKRGSFLAGQQHHNGNSDDSDDSDNDKKKEEDEEQQEERKRKRKSSQSSKGDREQVYRCAVPVVDAFSAIPTT